jgi:hypothetical protein
MGVVRLKDELLQELQDWLDENGNKYRYPSLSAFVNNAVYDKLKELKNKK